MLRKFVLIVSALFFSQIVFGLDLVRVESPLSDTDKRTLYKNELIRLSLEATKAEFGDYLLVTDGPVISQQRAIRLIQDGRILNAYITATSDEWEKQSLAIRIPIRKGLSSYRLLLIHKGDESRFANVETLADLKVFRSGSIGTGTVTRVLQQHGFDLQVSLDFDGVFQMLSARRYDFIARGVNEIYGEIGSGNKVFDNLVIEPHLAIYMPIATYLFVSPEYPQLAKRLEIGLKTMRSNGSFDKLFNEYYGESIRAANIAKRHVITIDNMFLPKSVPVGQQGLWFDPI